MDVIEPVEWVKRLDDKLEARSPSVGLWNDYYEGKHPLLFATEKFRTAFNGLFSEFADNWCAPVVNAVDERLAIEGFRFGADNDADQAAWEIWQRNHMASQSKLAIKSALIDSASYLLVWPDEKTGDPKITVESAEQMIVECACDDPYQRDAAWKRWIDEWTGDTFGALYLPDGIYKYRQKVETPVGMYVPIVGIPGGYRPVRSDDWAPREVAGEPWPLPNPYGVVPVFELPNDKRLARSSRSELESVIPLQNAVNKLFLDMMVASEFGAFKQKWLTGYEVPIDPETNQPIETFRAAIDRLFIAPPAEEGGEPARFGEFTETNLSNFVTAIDMAINHLAAQSRTPPHYLSSSADRLSGESIQSATDGLVAKAEDKQLYMGEAIAEAMRFAFLIAGDDAKAENWAAETIWKDAATRSEAAHIDAVGKMRQLLDLPREAAWEEAKFSPARIERLRAQRKAEQEEDRKVAAENAPTPGEVPPPPDPDVKLTKWQAPLGEDPSLMPAPAAMATPPTK